MDKNLFGERLKNARIMQGFSMDDLVTNSVSKTAISKYKHGILSPNSSIIISFSKVLNQPVDYFFRPFSVKIGSIKFRKTKKLFWQNLILFTTKNLKKFLSLKTKKIPKIKKNAQKTMFLTLFDNLLKI